MLPRHGPVFLLRNRRNPNNADAARQEIERNFLPRCSSHALRSREAFRLAANDDVTRLYRNIFAAEAATVAGEIEKQLTLNHESLRMLARIAGNPIVVIFMDGLMGLLVEFIPRLGTCENEEIFASRRRFMRISRVATPRLRSRRCWSR